MTVLRCVLWHKQRRGARVRRAATAFRDLNANDHHALPRV